MTIDSHVRALSHIIIILLSISYIIIIILLCIILVKARQLIIMQEYHQLFISLYMLLRGIILGDYK